MTRLSEFECIDPFLLSLDNFHPEDPITEGTSSTCFNSHDNSDWSLSALPECSAFSLEDLQDQSTGFLDIFNLFTISSLDDDDAAFFGSPLSQPSLQANQSSGLSSPSDTLSQPSISSPGAIRLPQTQPSPQLTCASCLKRFRNRKALRYSRKSHSTPQLTSTQPSHPNPHAPL